MPTGCGGRGTVVWWLSLCYLHSFPGYANRDVCLRLKTKLKKHKLGEFPSDDLFSLPLSPSLSLPSFLFFPLFLILAHCFERVRCRLVFWYDHRWPMPVSGLWCTFAHLPYEREVKWKLRLYVYPRLTFLIAVQYHHSLYLREDSPKYSDIQVKVISQHLR